MRCVKSLREQLLYNNCKLGPRNGIQSIKKKPTNQPINQPREIFQIGIIIIISPCVYVPKSKLNNYAIQLDSMNYANFRCNTTELRNFIFYKLKKKNMFLYVYEENKNKSNNIIICVYLNDEQ